MRSKWASFRPVIILSLILLFSGCTPPAEALSSQQASPAAASVASAPEGSESSTLDQTSASYLPCKDAPENMEVLVGQANPYPIGFSPRGIILPHHLVAAPMIVSALSGAAEANPEVDTVVVLAPNHSGLGGSLLTTQKGFSTPLGNLENDKDLTDLLLRPSVGAVENDQTLAEDHSASALMPFIKAIFPESKICVLLFSRSASILETSRAADAIMNYSQDHSVLCVGSIDFSHGLTPFYANQNDAYAASILTGGDPSTLFSLGNDYLDSPQAAYALMKITAAAGRTLEKLDHSHALYFLQSNADWVNNEQTTTTYMIFAG